MLILEDVDYLDSQLAPEESIPSHEELELEAERSLQARIIQEEVTSIKQVFHNFWALDLLLFVLYYLKLIPRENNR